VKGNQGETSGSRLVGHDVRLKLIQPAAQRGKAYAH